MSEQLQQKVQMRMRMFDDVFHATIIALERLEHFLLLENVSALPKITAIHTERDLHDDAKRIPTVKLLYGEVQLQCSALFFQTKFEDEKLFFKTVRYFLIDLLQWYGGRSDTIPFDDVDKFFIPIASALDRQVQDVTQIMQTVRKYVGDIENDISHFSEDEKEKAVLEGFEAFLKAQDAVSESYKQIDEKVEFTFTGHERGSVNDGLTRLYRAYLDSYNEKLPILFLEQLCQKYLPEVAFESTHLFLEKIHKLKQSNPSNQ